MKIIIIFIVSIFATLQFFATFSTTAIGAGFKLKVGHRKRLKREKLNAQDISLKNVNMDTSPRLGNRLSDSPFGSQSDGGKIHRDLAAKLRINHNTAFFGKTKDELIGFMNSENSQPFRNGSIHVNPSLKDSLLDTIAVLGLPVFSNDTMSILNLMALIGLPNCRRDPVFVMNLMAKVGLSVVSFGKPIASVAGSAALAFAFSRIESRNQDRNYMRLKMEDKIYANIYKEPSGNNEYIISPNSLCIDTKKIRCTNKTGLEFQSLIHQAYFMQRSLGMVASNLGNQQ